MSAGQHGQHRNVVGPSLAEHISVAFIQGLCQVGLGNIQVHHSEVQGLTGHTYTDCLLIRKPRQQNVEILKVQNDFFTANTYHR